MDEIHKYEGTINQFIGDGVMALFGAPVAHEDHANRACHAALLIQKAMIFNFSYRQLLKKDIAGKIGLQVVGLRCFKYCLYVDYMLGAQPM